MAMNAYSCTSVVDNPTNVCTCITFAGTGLILRHLRDGQEILPPLDQDLKYDFNFQQFRYISPRKVLPVSLSYQNEVSVIRVPKHNNYFLLQFALLYLDFAYYYIYSTQLYS